MVGKIYKLYSQFFAKKKLFKLHYLLYKFSLRGMGILNFENFHLSGEAFFFKHVVSRFATPVVVDVGANVGAYASSACKANADAQIYAFEPHPSTFDTLQSNADQHGFQAIQSACGSEEGTLTLYDYDQEGTSHASAVEGVIKDIHGKEQISTEVPVTTIDTFARNRNVDCIDVLKIDTEGYELDVLKGARSMIDSGAVRCVQIEFNEMNVKSRTFAIDLVEILDGYRFYRLLPDGLVDLGEYNPLKYEIFGFQNIVAIKESEEKIIESVK